VKIARLTEFGIPEAFVARWADTIGPELLDWQADAIRHFNLLGDGNLIAIAPTSSGKTFLAELAATSALMRRRKVVYIAPLKALVMQKYERLRTVFGPLGFRVVVSTRDWRGADARLRRGDFDIAVTVYEKWHNLLLTHLDLLTTVDLLILDEPQLLIDPKRGPTVAAILDAVAAVRHDQHRIASERRAALRVILLAARLPYAAQLSSYLNAPIQTVHRRPVELRLGVLTNGRFQFREYNTADVGEETLPWDDQLPESERPLALLAALAARGERILVFCPSKNSCHRRAQALVARLPSTVRVLSEEERWRLRSGPSLAAPLTEWLRHGVAVHHADLTPHQRAVVETRFAAGDVPVLFCTGTLAWGVNLPATTVFVDAEKYSGGPYGGRLIPVPIDRLEFEGMAGRAGRLGLAHDTASCGERSRTAPVGRGILWSKTPCEADLLWNAYITPHDFSTPLNTPIGSLSHGERVGVRESDTAGDRFAPLTTSELSRTTCGERGRTTCANGPRRRRGHPPCGEHSRTALPAFGPARRLLDWIVTGLASTVADAQARAQQSPFGPADPAEGPPLRTVWEPAAQRLIDARLVQCDADRRSSFAEGPLLGEDGRLYATPCGSVVAASGIGIETAVAITRALEGCRRRSSLEGHRSSLENSDCDPASWIALLTTLPEASDAHLLSGALHAEHRRAIAALWRDRFGGEFLETLAEHFAADPAAVTVHFPNEAPQTRAMLTALALDDWAAGISTDELEHRYRLPIGRLAPTADLISWLLETTALLAKNIASSRGIVPALERAAFEVRHGISWGAQSLVQALEGVLPRQTLLELIADGWNDPVALATRRPDELIGYAPLSVVEQILKRCRQWSQRAARDTKPGQSESNTLSIENPTTCPEGSRGKGEPVMSPILHLDGAAHRARLTVQLAGRTVLLRAKSFKYLLALAAARLLSRDGWIAKTDIEPGENQIKYLYQLRRELRIAGGAHSRIARTDTDALIENDGHGHYRLGLPPQAIQFDLERLLTHPDWDIRVRAEQLSAHAQSERATTTAHAA
jgi:replicative superfamily II helicase